MASILKNLAPPFDSSKTYKYGDRFVTGGRMYQVLEPFSGELDMNKLVEVTIADLVKGGYPPYDSFAGESVEAASVTSDEQNTYLAIPKPGFYNEDSKIFTDNSNLNSSTATQVVSYGQNGGDRSYNYTATETGYYIISCSAAGLVGTNGRASVNKNGIRVCFYHAGDSAGSSVTIEKLNSGDTLTSYLYHIAAISIYKLS